MTRSQDDSGVRCLHRPGYERAPQTNVVPVDRTPTSRETRETLTQFLSATLMKPLWSSDQQQQTAIQEAMDTMTIDERITIEIEMQSRNATVHSFDYDPLRG